MDVLVDLTWGDNGKGRMIDYLSPDYDIVCRFNGGNNAGHVIYNNDVKYVFHMIPSGILNKKICLIGNGCVLNPIKFIEEIKDIQSKVDFNILDYIILSDKIHLITPVEIIQDGINDEKQKIGTTKSGNGPTYSKKALREGFRLSDIKDSDFILKYLEHVYLNCPELFPDEFSSEFLKAIFYINKNIKILKTEIYLNNQISNYNKKVIAEGAQGTLLDIDFGTYPYVTSSSTVSGSACIGLGISPKKIDKIFGLTKCYTTRVGNGNFSTELFGPLADNIIKYGGEYGSTTGRTRRIGWLDLNDIDYSIMINGVTHLCLTKYDVLVELGTFKIKNLSGELITFKTPSKEVFEEYKHICVNDINEEYKLSRMPIEMIEFLNYLKTELNINITYFSLGKDRNEIIKLN